MIAIGLGCRRGCAGSEIAALVRRACERAGVDAALGRLFTVAAKENEAGMMEAAALLDLPLVYLPAEVLAQEDPRLATRSERVVLLFGMLSVAEAAALAGAGKGGQLLGPRLASAAATCAIAVLGEVLP